jgi:hypothetical protein
MRPDRRFEYVIGVIYRLCLVLTVLVGAVGLAAQQQAPSGRTRHGVDGRGSRVPRHVGLHPPKSRRRRRTQCAAGGAEDGHPGRTRQLDAANHRRHPRVAGARGHLGCSVRCASRQRRNVHPLRQPYRRHGACDEPRRCNARRDRRGRRGSRSESVSLLAASGEDAEPGPGDRASQAPPLPGTAMERKAINDAVAYIRGLAELRGRERRLGRAGGARGRQPHLARGRASATSSTSSPRPHGTA